MTSNDILKESTIIFISALVIGLGLSFTGNGFSSFIIAFLTILLILLINIFAKKIFGYHLETNVTTKFWTIYHFGLKNKNHFKNKLAMIWLPLFTSFITTGNFVWLAITEFDVSAKPERVAKRHGLYRYTEVTEWHISLIAVAGILANIFFGILAYLFGFEYFAKWSIIYAFWSIVPFGRLDGSKIFFGSRNLWFGLSIILFSLLIWGLTIV